MLRKGHVLAIFVIVSSVITLPFSFASSPVHVSIPSLPSHGVPGCEQTNQCFIPSSVTIETGEQIIWTNNDLIAHTVTSGNPSNANSVGALFDSGVLNPGDQLYLEFSSDEVGIHDYFCILPPWAIGEVIVLEPEMDDFTLLQPSTKPDIDWESKYYDALSKFNDASAKVGELQQQNDILQEKISELEKKIENLNALVMEQLQVIYNWVINR